jgi:hypothetical protein
MFCFPLTSWITIRGANGSTVTQGESQWLDLRGFEDVVAWLQCNEVTKGGASNVTLAYQTAPTKDELLFTTSGSVNLAAGSTPVITTVLMSSASVPLARWLRWQLTASGSTSTFDATFRLWIAANIGPHPLRPKTSSPPLRQNGKSCNGDCQKGGSRPTAGYMPPSRDMPPSGNTNFNRTVGRANPTVVTPGPSLTPGLGKRPPEHLVRPAGPGMVPRSPQVN